MRVFSSLTVLFLVAIFQLKAQLKIEDYGRYDSITVSFRGDTLENPWVGGLNNPQFSECDLNQDGITDLFVYDRDHQAPRIYLGLQDSLGKKYWHHQPEYEANFPRMWSWALLRDYDRDGKMDLFTSWTIGDIRLFRNVSTGPDPEDIAFEHIKFRGDPNDTTIFEDYMTCKFRIGGNFIYTNVYNLSSDIPGIIDVDGDGDMDILAFGNSSTGVYFYENKSMDENFNDDSMKMELNHLCWGRFEEDVNTFQIILQSCTNGVVPMPPGGRGGGSRHEGSTILVEDFDCNGQKDILLGDIAFPKMVLGYNTGTKDSASITSQDTLFPSNGVPINVETFPAGYYVDTDHDDIKDLVIAPNADQGISNFNQVHVYENSGNNFCPKLAFEKKDFLVGEMIDLGTHAYPLIIDVNGDSLKDLLVGSKGVWTQSATFESRLSYYQNVGSKTNPQFELITRDYLLLPQSQDSGLYPTAGDLDNDGDLDLLLGTERGVLLYFENQAQNPGDSLNLVYKRTSFSDMDFGKSIRPYLFDVNSDGMLDILMGSQLSYINYYENLGVDSVPHFDTSSFINNWGGINHTNFVNHGNLSVVIKDLDTAGNNVDTITDLASQRQVFVGTSNGSIFRYNGMNSTGIGILNGVDSLFMFSKNVAISLADITGDNKPDFLVGEVSGGLNVLLKDGGNIILPPPDTSDTTDTTGVFVPNPFDGLKIFPNPTNDVVNIHLNNEEELIRLKLFDISGRIVLSDSFERTTSINLQDLPSGLYWLTLENKSSKINRRIVKIDH